MALPRMSAYRLGSRAAAAVFLIGLAYLLTLVVGVVRFGNEPIRDPVLAVMETLTLLSAPALLVAMAAVLMHARADRRIFGVIAFALTTLFAGTTCVVHFVELTAVRQLGSAEIRWPSLSYAAELLAWDWFLGLALLFAAPVFAGQGRERPVRRGLWICGALTLAGTVGPLLGDMRLQRIGILGYGVVLPFVFLRLSLLFGSYSRGDGQ